jgi:glycosyltransferase involved in cell wall biosynthesis
VQENNQAAIYLIKKIFDELPYKLTISGSTPSDMLKKEMKKSDKYHLVESPYDEQMQSLIENAQINVLPTFQPTGIKLKLINALYNGRWVIANPFMVQNTGLEELCIVAGTADEMIEAIITNMNKPFTQEIIEKRKKVLQEKFSNEANALQLIKLIYGSLQ